jgi:hypothetical protein
MWTGATTAAGMLAGIWRRVMKLAFGRAIAFTYAVIVSVVANVVFDFVRHPPRGDATEPMTADETTAADSAAARASLPAASVTTVVNATPIIPPPQPAPAPAENPRPGPGSGGLY